MASKTTIAAALVVALGIGAVSGVMVAGEAADKPPALEAIVDEEREAPEAKQPVIDMTQYVPRQEFDALQKSLATINSDKDKQAEINTSALDQLKRENRDLLTKIAELEHKLNPPLKGEDLAIVFGDYNGVENLREVDWDKAGEAMIKMIGLMDQLYRSTKTGQRMDPKAMSELQTENNKLIDVALKVMGEVPSNIGNINGEFTHPIVTANILAAHLEAAGLPLSADQHETIAGYGQDFVVKWDKANKSYTDKTFKIEKIMDEVKLKEEFMAKTKAALTPAQLQLLGTPDISGISMFDIYSPLIALQGNFHDVTADSSGDTKSKIADAISSHTEMPKEDVLIRFGPVLDTWTTEFSEKLQPATAIILQTYNVEEVIIACKAQMKATEDILELLSPAPELERSIRDNASIIIGKLKINDK